ncbi:hypothetical protein PEC301879_33170 [Pectobacterium carotovorum subsp. carotovorum]|nr:hypothetical protein PEC301879_33170 [Pectobacterium carotovorum subsp. carotovorum]
MPLGMNVFAEWHNYRSLYIVLNSVILKNVKLNQAAILFLGLWEKYHSTVFLINSSVAST